jgi:hypothetical protein
MLSTIVSCEDRSAGEAAGGLAENLMRTLASLVTAKVEGLLSDVTIAGPAGMGLGAAANHAGCNFVEEACEEEWLSRALEAARGPYILVLRSGYAPEPGFVEEANDFLAGEAKGQLPPAVLRAAPASFLERMAPSLAPAGGLIAPRDLLLRAAAGSFPKLVRRIAPAAAFRTRLRRVG